MNCSPGSVGCSGGLWGPERQEERPERQEERPTLVLSSAPALGAVQPHVQTRSPQGQLQGLPLRTVSAWQRALCRLVKGERVRV